MTETAEKTTVIYFTDWLKNATSLKKKTLEYFLINIRENNSKMNLDKFLSKYDFNAKNFEQRHYNFINDAFFWERAKYPKENKYSFWNGLNEDWNYYLDNAVKNYGNVKILFSRPSEISLNFTLINFESKVEKKIFKNY